ncbi:hypothetical protein Daura_37370 [Dactylosporangium aurantiacum]|uniref:Uncharacterized protein n=1 Tax=Dactylosporangium aurantiacum TaxID=35754 RepID=A0A9Q9IAN9_9ACTN|nr:hypothetical protein [Dactylosporangium aurantiacum]MDG6101912.1 hypothetical protein [Dactylosporangium aurantiacum]UWZ52291.1 hypothetical protein Daura_37370 [Dactylosporangium aurantiacum]
MSSHVRGPVVGEGAGETRRARAAGSVASAAAVCSTVMASMPTSTAVLREWTPVAGRGIMPATTRMRSRPSPSVVKQAKAGLEANLAKATRTV